jgi:acyl carrier protein
MSVTVDHRMAKTSPQLADPLDGIALIAWPGHFRIVRLMAVTNVQRSALHGQVTTLWAEALELDSSEVLETSDFFDLGGHSLAAIRMTAQLRDLVDSQVPLELIFEQPVLADYIGALADYGPT